MNIMIVDDERLALQEMEDAVSTIVPEAKLFSFQNADEALAFASTTPIDIAFWEINMDFMGLFIVDIIASQMLLSSCPDCNIIFCIAHGKYVKDVPRIKHSDYLLKPITPEKVQAALAHLRQPLKE